MNENDRLITIKELMTLCGIRSKNTIAKRLQSGDLPAPVKQKKQSHNTPRRWWLSDVLRALGREI